MLSISDFNRAEDNLEFVEDWANSSSPTAVDRLGRTRKTIQGFSNDVSTAATAAVGAISVNAAAVEDAAEAAQTEIDARIAEVGAEASAMLAALGYLPPVVYTSGLSMTSARQTVAYSGLTYAPKADQIPFTTSGTFETAKFRLIQGVAGADLAADTGAAMVGHRGLNLRQVLDMVGGMRVINVDIQFGGDLVAAHASITGNAVLECGFKTYNALSLPNNTKPNVWIVGKKVPSCDYAQKRLADGTGTVLQGTVYNTAKGFGLFNLGIDRGEWVRTNMAAGVYRDTFVNADFGTNGNIRYGNLIILESETVSGDSNSNTHCILNERGTGVFQTGPVEVIDGYHGHVVKVQDFYGVGQATVARYQFGDAAIIKTDPTPYAPTLNVKMGRIIIDGDGSRPSSGVLYENQGDTLAAVSIESIEAVNARWAIIEALDTTGPIVGLTIGHISAEVITGAQGADAAVVVGAHTIGMSIGRHRIEQCAKGGIYVAAGAISPNIGTGLVKGVAAVPGAGTVEAPEFPGHGYEFGADCQHGALQAVSNDGWGVKNNGNAQLDATQIVCIANELGGISSLTTLSFSSGTGWAFNGDGMSRFARYGSEVKVSVDLRGGSTGGWGSGYNWRKVGSISGPLPAMTSYMACFAFTSGGVPVPNSSARILANGDVEVYASPADSPGGLVISGSYVCQSNQ